MATGIELLDNAWNSFAHYGTVVTEWVGDMGGGVKNLASREITYLNNGWTAGAALSVIVGIIMGASIAIILGAAEAAPIAFMAGLTFVVLIGGPLLYYGRKQEQDKILRVWLEKFQEGIDYSNFTKVLISMEKIEEYKDRYTEIEEILKTVDDALNKNTDIPKHTLNKMIKLQTKLGNYDTSHENIVDIEYKKIEKKFLNR